MYSQARSNGPAVASVEGDVQTAQLSASSPTHTAGTQASTAASSPTVPRHITTQLHCQAAVVRVGEQFAEFQCSVFRSSRPTNGRSALKAMMMAAHKQAAATASSSSAADHAVNAAAAADDGDAAAQHESALAAPLSSHNTGGEGDNADSVDHYIPVHCTEEDVPRWQLLVYTVVHHSGSAGAKEAGRPHNAAPTASHVSSAASAGRTDAGSEHVLAGVGRDGEAEETTSLDALPVPGSARVCFFQTMPTAKLSKVVKLAPGARYTVLVRCYARATAQWSPWSAAIQTATQFPVVTRIVEIGSDYVHCMWDRAAQRSEAGLAKELDPVTTDWCRSIPGFELRFLRESDMAEHYVGSFEAGCRSQTVRALHPGTAYIVMMRYMTMLRTMGGWTEVTRLVTESQLELKLESRSEDTFSFSWARTATLTAGRILAASAVPSATAFLEEDSSNAAPASTTSVAGYLLPRVPVHEYELIVESADLRFDPIIVPAAVTRYTMERVFPSTTYSVCVRALSEEGRWGGRSLPLVVRTADRPNVSVAAVGESFASLAWSRKQEEAQETKLQYRVQSLTSAYTQAETVDLPASAPRLLNVEHLRAGSQYLITLRVAIGTAWGQWTEPLRFTTAPSAALTFLERGEDFLTLNWPSAGPATSASEEMEFASTASTAAAAAASAAAVYNIVVVKCGPAGERTSVLNERVTRDPTQRGFRVSDLEADTAYDVQCRTWQRNPMTGYEGWGEFSAPVRMQTLQPVALHVWDVGEDFIHVVWRRGLSEQSDSGAGAVSAAAASTNGADSAGSTDWDRLKYEIIVGCVESGEEELLHRQVLDTSFTISQLKPSTTYTISVRACDEHGQWGLWSEVRVLTLASVRTSVDEIGEDFVRLVWQRCGGDDSANLYGVTVADHFVAKYSVFVYARELPGMPVAPHVQSGYSEGGGRADVAQHDVVSSEHTSLRVGDLLPDREYVAVVRAATASGRWGLWSRPIRFRTNPQFRIPAQQLTIGENYVSVVWSREEVHDQATAAEREEGEGPLLLGDLTVTGQELRIHGVTTQYAREYALEPDVRELKMSELHPACAYTIQIRVRGRSGCWGLWSSPVHILTRGTLAVTTDEVAEDFISVRWERRKVANPHQYPTGRGVVTSYHLRVYNSDGVHMETFLGDGDCPYRVTGLKANTYYCVELKANYNDEEWGLWSVPLWCLTMQPMRIQARLISEEFCCLQLSRPTQQRRLPEDDGNLRTEERVLAHGRVRPTIMLCVTSPILSKAPYNTAAAAGSAQAKPTYLNDALPPDAAEQRLVYQTELLNSAETVEHTVPNLKCNTVYSVSVRTKLANGEWGMWSPSLVFATVPATRVSFTSIGESFVGVEWVRHAQVVPPQIASPENVVLGVATITASRVRVRESGGAYQHTYTVEGATTSLRVDHLSPATTYMVCVQTFNDNYEWGVWSEEQKVRTVPGMDIHIQHVSEDALWASWSRRTDLHVGGDADTVFNVNISARTYEVCILGEGGFTYTLETASTALFFRGLLPDAVYTVHVRALFAQSDYWGLWSAQAFRTKPRLRVTFGNIGDHFVMLEWRRHLPKPTDTELRLTATESDGAPVKGTADADALLPVGGGMGDDMAVLATASVRSGRGRGAALMAGPSLPVAETEDVVQLYRFKVQRVGEAHPSIYNIAPTVSSFRLRDLQPSSEYRVWVCAKGYEGVWGFWSEESRVRTLPRLQLEVLNIGEDYVRAKWRRGAWAGESMAAEDGTEVRQVDGAVSGYEVRVLDTEGSVAATNTTTFRDAGVTLSGLQLSSLYSIQVRAKDTYDAWGLWSDPVAFYTLKPVIVGLQRVGETFAAVHWSRHAPLLTHRRSTDFEDDFLVMTPVPAEDGMHADSNSVLHPDERVTRWHMRVSCNRVFAGMPQSEDYREMYAEEGESALQIDGLLPHATYAITVRGLNYAGEWGHWSPPLYVSTCPLLKVAVEMAGETFLQVEWQRPAARTGVTGYADPEKPPRRELAGASGTLDVYANELSHNPNNATLSMPLSDASSTNNTRPLVSGMHRLDDDGDGEERGSSMSASLSSATPESYLCFPSESEVHNYQVTIRPMPMEPAFDEADEPLVEGARVYETTQPGLRLGNLLPGCRYAITVREQQISEDGRPVSGVWGAASEVVCTQTVPPVHVIPQEIGEDYCVVEWRRAESADESATNGSVGADAQQQQQQRQQVLPTTTVLAAATTAGRKAIEFQLQTRRMEPDGVTLYSGPLSMNSTISVPSSASTYHISSLVPSSVYEVRVRAKMEGGQWGIWSLATRFLTQSRLQLHVDRVQEVAVRLSWRRATATVMGAADHRTTEVADLEGGEKPSSTSTAAGAGESEATADGVSKSVTIAASATAELAVAAHVILPNDAVHEYEVLLEGISTDHHRRLTVGQDTQSMLVEGLEQDQLYCVSVRSLSEQQHWSRFSTKVTVLTLAPVAVRVAQYTESTALLEWHRPLPDVERFGELLGRHQRDALQQCDERERRELFEMKRKIQELESKGEAGGMAKWVDSAAREEHNAMLREEATMHYHMDDIVVGNADSSGYELRLTLQDGAVCLPYIAEVERLRLRATSKMARPGSLRDLLNGSRRAGPGASTTRGLFNSTFTAATAGLRERKKEVTIKMAATPAGQSVTMSNLAGVTAAAAGASPTGAAPQDCAVELLDVQLQPTVTQVLVQGLSPDSTFAATVRGRSGSEAWQPWSAPTQLETLSRIQLDQSRFGEHYVNLFWYREEAGAMAAAAAETEEYRRLQHEFHNFTDRDLESRRNTLDSVEYTALVNRLRRLRVLRRLATARARRHAEGELALLADPACPVRGFQLRVIDEAGTMTEHYLPNDAARPTLSFTATGLQPNNMYVCRLCPHYGNDVWGCWTTPLKYMTHNLIQLDLTYISETFVDLEWWRLDNKEVTRQDVNDTLLSSRYTEEKQVYQLRITHEDAETGEEVEEFRDMQASNVLRIDALLPDMKYTIAVREWDAKGDWGLWSAACSCVTLPSMEVAVTNVKECSAAVSWARATPRIDYESDMHVLEGNVEVVGYYLRVEEILVRSRAPAEAAGIGSPLDEHEHAQAGDLFSEPAESTGDLSLELDDTQLLNNSFHGVPSVGFEDKPRTAEVDELEGTLAFGFQRGGPLPPEPHPQLYDGIVTDSADTGAAKPRQHYLMVRKITSSTEQAAALTELKPQTIYCVQVMAETTGGQVGPWSAPHYLITTPRIRLSPACVHEHYAALQWGRTALAPLAALLSGPSSSSSSSGAAAYAAGGKSGARGSSSTAGQRSSASAVEAAGRRVTLPTLRAVAFELEVFGIGSDFALSTRLDAASPTGSFRVVGLALDSLYAARVRSFNEAGEASLWSEEQTFVTLKPIVVHPNEITENRIEIEWGRPEQSPEAYRAKLAQWAERGEGVAGAAGSLRSTSALALPGAGALAGSATSAQLLLPAVASASAAAAAVSRGAPLVAVGARDAVKYHVRVYHASESQPPQLLLEKHLNGNVTTLTVSSLTPNSIYLMYVRAVNHDGVWSEWSEGRCVYTMRPLQSSVTTVGEDFVRLQWSREAPEEVHYAPQNSDAAAAAHNNNSSNTNTATLRSVKERGNDSDAALATADGAAQESSDSEDHLTQSARSDGALAATTTAADSPGAALKWQRRRRFHLLDKPADDVGPVYRSSTTSIVAYVVSVRRSEEAEGFTVEVPGNVHQHTLPALQPDSLYLISVRAKYGSGEWSPWSETVRTGTYNLLALDIKEVGEDYFAAAWQRKSNTINMNALHIGKVEETVCYEMRVRDYSDVPLGEEEGEVARQRDQESRSLFLHPNQRHSVTRELASNRRYRLAVRRWYQPHDGFATVTDRDSDGDGVAALRRATTQPASADGAVVTIDAVLRESMEKTRALPGVWSESEYVVTLRGMVCAVERVGEEFFQLRWARDPRAVPLPVRRAMPMKPVQTYQLRIDEMLRDGSAVETTRGSGTFHLDELMPPSETSYFNKSLRPNTLYKIEVRCCIEKTWGRWSRPVYVITLPCLKVELSRIGEECATIAWHRPREPLTLPDGEAAVLGDEEEAEGSYQLEVSGVGFSYQVAKRLKASRTSYTVKHLDADALYSVRVRWGDGVNQSWSLWSDVACFATLKPLRVHLSMPTEHFVNVEWSRPPQTAEEYVARMEQQPGAAITASTATAAASAAAAAPSATAQPTPSPAGDETAANAAALPEAGEVAAPSNRSSLVAALASAVQLGNPGSLAYHLCVFNTQQTPSMAVVDKQYHKDVTSYRVNGLNADTPYVVIIRACCEATGDWGLWSDERPFRTRKLLAPSVASVGENYAELTWEQADGAEQPRAAGSATGAVGSAAAPTKYLLVLRSTQHGTVEREITPEECGVAQEEGYHQAPRYRLRQLQPGTEYAVALQPCYGGTGDWGLWSQAVVFTTLHTLQLSATVRRDTAELSWCRLNPPRAVEIAVDPVMSGQTADATADAPSFSSGGAAAAPQPGAILLPAAPLVSTRTVSRYQLVMYRESDVIALRQQQHSALENSISTALPSTTSLPPAVAGQERGAGERPPSAGGPLSPHAYPLPENLSHAIEAARRVSRSPLLPPRSSRAGAEEDYARTAIPDMDMAALVSLESPGAPAAAASIFLFRKTYDLTDANTATAASNAASSSAKGSGGRAAHSGNMFERVEGLTPDTVYIARLRAMDLFGHWGAFVEQRLITPPLPPAQVTLRRVNAQFCALQWAAPNASSAPAATAAAAAAAAAEAAEANSAQLSAEPGQPPAHYRYIIELCCVAADAPLAAGAGSGVGGSGAAPGSANASRRGGAGGNAGGAGAAAGGGGAEWHVVDTVEDSTVCAVRITGLLNRMRCRIKCARRYVSPPTLGEDGEAGDGSSAAMAPPPSHFLGPYSDFSEVVAVSSGTPPEGIQELHLTTLSQNAATLEWLPPPKPSEAAAGRYTRPHYRIYLANTTDQPYPVLLTTVHRPTFALTNLTPATTYTVQVVAENNDGVSFRNPVLLFHTKAEDDTTVSRVEEGTAKDAAAAAAPLGEIVAFHGPRALQQQAGHGGSTGDGGEAVAEIPTAPRRLTGGPVPPSPALQRGRGGRGNAGGRARGVGRDSLRGSTGASAASAAAAAATAGGEKRPSSSPQRDSSVGRMRSTSVKGKAKAKGGKKDSSAGAARKKSGGTLPPLSKTA